METYDATSDAIACTLTQDDLRETRNAWQKLFRLSLVSRDEVPGGLRLLVHPGSADALRQLINIERECCRWITFVLDGPVVTMTSPGAGESAIRAMWGEDRSAALSRSQAGAVGGRPGPACSCRLLSPWRLRLLAS